MAKKENIHLKIYSQREQTVQTLYSRKKKLAYLRLNKKADMYEAWSLELIQESQELVLEAGKGHGLKKDMYRRTHHFKSYNVSS